MNIIRRGAVYRIRSVNLGNWPLSETERDISYGKTQQQNGAVLRAARIRDVRYA